MSDLHDQGIPPASSVRDEDPHRLAWIMRHGRQFDVLLDGRPLTKVISYDVVRGSVLRFATDEAGKVQFREGRSGLVEEMLTGRVEARWRPGFGPSASSPMETPRGA